MSWRLLPAEATDFQIDPVRVETARFVYPRHIVDWHRPLVTVRDGAGTVWLTGTVALAEQEPSVNAWRFTLDDGTVLDVTRTGGCACGGAAPIARG